jgi:hypothetical protein
MIDKFVKLFSRSRKFRIVVSRICGVQRFFSYFNKHKERKRKRVFFLYRVFLYFKKLRDRFNNYVDEDFEWFSFGVLSYTILWLFVLIAYPQFEFLKYVTLFVYLVLLIFLKW